MAVLWGRQHVDYGRVESVALSPEVGIALTRGLRPKTYRWVDPNEDVAAAVVGERATLLAVADGHNGVLAPEVAITTVLDELGDDPPPEPDDAEIVGLFHRAGLAVLAATRDVDDPQRRDSRTTLSLALVSGRRLCWAAMGDSSVLVAEAGQGVELTQADNAYLGSPMAFRRIDRLLQRGRGTLGARAWVALTTDGFANFSPGPSAAAAAGEILGDPKDGATAACELIDYAFEGGAGDNIAVAVAGPGDGGGRAGTA
jgi:serine/threonine protein phosphatase PrpC